MKEKIISFVFLTIFFAQEIAVFSCGPSLYPDEATMNLFRFPYDETRRLEPFYYSENFLNSYIPDPEGLDYQRNCEEWRKYTGNTVRTEDIYELQYKTDPDQFIRAYEKKQWKNFPDNQFVKWLILSANREALEYFYEAKKIENTQYARMEDSWDFAPDKKSNAIDKLIEKQAIFCLQKAESSKDTFLQQRYAFQAIKQAYYAGNRRDKKNAESYYDLYEKYLSLTNSVVKGWGVFFCGLMEPVNSEAYIQKLLLAFDLSEEKKVVVFRHLYNIRAKVEKFGEQHPEYKEVALAFKGAQTFGKNLDNMQEIYQTNPGSKYLPFLIGREINKLENWIWSYQYLKFDNLNNDLTFPTYDWDNYYSREREYPDPYLINSAKDLEYLRSFQQFLSKIEREHHNNTTFIKIAEVHLFNLNNEFSQSQKLLSSIHIEQNSPYYRQYLIEKILVTAKTDDILNEEVKARLAKDLLYFVTEKKDTSKEEKEYWELHDEEKDDLGELKVFLSKCYQDKKDLLTAGLLIQGAHIPINDYGYQQWDGYYDSGKVPFWNEVTKEYDYIDARSLNINLQNNYNAIAFFDKYGSIADIEDLIAFKHKKNKTAFEKILEPEGWASDDMFLDLIGTKYMRDKDYEKAYTAFLKVDDDFWNKQYEFRHYLPKNSIISLGTYAPWDTDTVKKYRNVSKKEILEDILSVTRALDKNPQDKEQRAELLQKLGNIQLNLTYNGRFWMMISYGNYLHEMYEVKDHIYEYSFYPNNIKYGAAYYRAVDALKTYQEALKLTKNKELKARLELNAVLCHQLNVWNKKKDFKIPENLKNTRAFEIASTTCPDFY